MKIDLNKEIKLNIPWNNNFFKTSIGCNTISLFGYIMTIFILHTYRYVSHEGSGELGFGLVLYWYVGSIILIILDAMLLFVSYIEFKKKHRLKNKFFTENNFYSLVFYAGIILNFLFVGLYIWIYFFAA